MGVEYIEEIENRRRGRPSNARQRDTGRERKQTGQTRREFKKMVQAD